MPRFLRKRLLIVGRFQALLLRQQPDLVKVNWLRLGGVELAVRNAPAGCHPLELPRPKHAAGPQAVPVSQGPLKDIGDDLHVLVAMGPKSLPWGDPVLVDDPQGTKAHVPRVIIAAERER